MPWWDCSIISIGVALLERALSKVETELWHVGFIFLRLANLLEAASQLVHLEAEQEVLVPGTIAEVIIVVLNLALDSRQDWFNRAIVCGELCQSIFLLQFGRGSLSRAAWG